MKIKFNKSIIIVIVAIIALFFFMSMRSNADGKPSKRGDGCGWIDGEVVRCNEGFCTVEPKMGGGQGTCVDRAYSWMRNEKGMTKKVSNSGGACGWIDGEIVRCKKSHCTVEPKKGGKKGTCGSKADSWRNRR
jgi:hypothetical protein